MTEINPSVVIADDDAINRAFLAATLAAAGWQVRSAADGAAAVERVREDLPDLVILDIAMPVLDGWGAAAAIRAGRAEVPILAFTSLPVGDAALRAGGFDGRIAKPCTPTDLVAAASAWAPADGATLERLEQVFGSRDLDDLLARLRDQFVAALAGVAGADERAAAHRLAGAAGTLGFAAASACWLALSEGSEDARESARNEARRAIVTIDRHLHGRLETPSH